ncbi:RND transporter [Lacimicrobium alkaliphilum]|uniref:RND transporter n=2 Tax=Lacimicrobium alkaliphilum TaxID=1526571 RepID=A0A0U2ZNM1_9ALTE|nr:RND transporter [Lacimicrobium alkaliphilum]
MRKRYGIVINGRRTGYLQSWRVLGLALTVGLAGCTAGPDFQRPQAPEVTRYTTTSIDTRTRGAVTTVAGEQQFITGMQVDERWWRSLKSPTLDRLIEEALSFSPSLMSAKATLRQAKEIYSAHAGSTLYPQVDAGLSVQRQRMNPNIPGLDGDAMKFSLYDASVGVRYSLDLAGSNRRTLEALAARVDYHRYEFQAAQLVLAGNIATAAITRARLAEQIESMGVILQNLEEQVYLARERLRYGQAAPDEVSAKKILAEQKRAELPTLRKQMQQTEHLIAVLAGRAPGEHGLPEFKLADFALPAELPLLIPSELVRHRPDIRASEALLHEANANYGAAIAKLYPQINLNANLGSQAMTTASLFSSGSSVWNLVGQLTQPLFNRGLPAEKRAAQAAFDAATANYQSVVLESFRNVADVLRAVENDAQALAAMDAANNAACDSLRSVEQQYRFGSASYVQLLIARQQAQQTQLARVAAQAQRLTNSVALYQVIGAG